MSNVGIDATQPDIDGGKPCPWCGYVRKPEQPGPRWHCPKCFKPYPETARVLAAADAEDAAAARAGPDHSILALIAANLFVIATVYWLRVPLLQVVLVYWTQRVIIGVSFFIRMRLRSRAAGERSSPERFFLLHYGLFHLGYLAFLMILGVKRLQPIHLGGAVAFCALIFALNHAYSLWYNVSRDRDKRADPEILFWIPYARILPMHCILLVIGSGYPQGNTLLLFLALRMFADVAMHQMEHRWLRRPRTTSGRAPSRPS